MSVTREGPIYLDVTPIWWRIPAWAAITAYSVVQAHGLAERIATGVLLGVGSLVLQLNRNDDIRVRQASLLVSTLTGLAASYTAPAGLAEILVAIAASRAALAIDGRVLRWFTVLDSIALGLTVAYISRSPAGLLAGVGIPLLVQRAVEHRDLVRERDRVTALLAEVQRGRESEAQAAALQERGRIAREMHDVLAHSLAGLSVQLQAVRAVAAREQVGTVVLEPLDKAAMLARDGLAEARSAVSTLRDPVGLGLGELPALVERHPGAARLDATGTPGTVDAATGHAVYRSVQEALTNAVRYAPGGSVLVELRWEPTRLLVTVEDTGPAPGRSPVGGQGTGLGLAGMGERLVAVAGTLQAGPAETGGWRVEIGVPAGPAPNTMEVER